MSSELLGSRVATLYELQSAWLEPRLAQLGVRWTTFQLLATIVGAGDEASQAEVARRLGVSPATLSESVQNHVKDGLIEQIPSTTDKRLKVLQLSPQGKKMMGKIRTLIVECEDLMSGSVSTQEAKTCAKVLDRMIESLERGLEP